MNDTEPGTATLTRTGTGTGLETGHVAKLGSEIGFVIEIYEITGPGAETEPGAKPVAGAGAEPVAEHEINGSNSTGLDGLRIYEVDGTGLEAGHAPRINGSNSTGPYELGIYEVTCPGTRTGAKPGP